MSSTPASSDRDSPLDWRPASPGPAASPGDPRLVHVACPLCDADLPRPWFVKEGFPHVRCARCGLVYVTPRLAAQNRQQERFYEGLARSAGGMEEALRADRKPRRLRQLARELAGYEGARRENRLLDVGCGFGAFLNVAKATRWRPFGVEMEARVAAHAEREGQVHQGELSNAPWPDAHFDLVRMNNVVEHLADPRAVVRRAARLLRPGGLLALATPNIRSLSVFVLGSRWRYIGGDDHIVLFSPATLGALVEDSGLRVLSVSSKGVHLTLKDRKHAVAPHGVRKAGRHAAAALEGALDLFVRFTAFGHRLKLLACKPEPPSR